MSTTGENASTICALMDSQITDAEWERNRQRAKFLHDCKTKGFSKLLAMGSANGGIELSKSRAIPDFDPLEFATQGAKMVNEQGMSITAVCDKFGRNFGDLRYYCDKFGINLKRKQRKLDYGETYVKVRRMINDEGYRLKEVAKRFECSTGLIVSVLASKGRKYNAKKIKIERIKK